MIIDQLTYSDKGSSIGTDSFLVNFDRLFENFVAKVLKEIPEKREFTTWSAKKRFADVIGSTGVYSGREYQPDIIYRYKEEDEAFDYMLQLLIMTVRQKQQSSSLQKCKIRS